MKNENFYKYFTNEVKNYVVKDKDFKYGLNINVPEEDKNVHLYLGYRGYHSDYEIIDYIAESINDIKRDNVWSGHFSTRMINNFLMANKDNIEVMYYLWINLNGDK